MELTYVYQKKRSEFGRQCMFNDRGPDLIDNYQSNKKLLNEYILRNPVNSTVQNATIQAEHDINTYRAEFAHGSMNHIEGGWPKDVNINDEEQTKRYKRKIEKDDAYPHIMGQLCKNMEECILQNNAINIYQQYYTDVEKTPIIEPSFARTVNVFQDQSTIVRPVTNMAWSPDGQRLAVTHCNLAYQAQIAKNNYKSYIWELENPNTPQVILDPPIQAVCFEYSHKDPNTLASGLFNGQIAIWDLRRSNQPVDISLMEVSHRDPVNNLIWIHSKTGTEFFTASTDGTIKWWDMRKMDATIETLIIDPVKAEEQSISNAMGCSVLEYESTIPTRFMIGTENGIVISCNRKGKAPLEKMGSRFNAHLGPVLALERNPAFVKNFLTVGDWCAKVWSEDCKESAIIWTFFHRARLSDGAWSPTRYSVFFTCRSDGILDVWDLLLNQERATIGVKICEDPLTTMRVNDNGRLTAVANKKGTSYVIELSENLTMSNKNDKQLLTAMFDRENRREKILEARNREIRLKQKTKSQGAAEVEVEREEIFSDTYVHAAEMEFYSVIEKETKPPADYLDDEEEGEEDENMLGDLPVEPQSVEFAAEVEELP